MSKIIARITVIASLVSFAIAPSLAAGLRDAQVAMVSGNWKVLRSIDTMKDTTDCTGIYKENYGIQLTKDTLYVSIKGGLEGVTLRFGDKPARRLRLAEAMEKKVGSIIIGGTDFSELIESDRLRVQASTLVRGIEEEDLDLTGIKDAWTSIKNECPIQVAKSVGQKPDKPAAPVCSEVLVNRMKVQGLKDSQIAEICK
jgi:hypothetical protein